MDHYKPLRAVLFSYDIVRLFFLAVSFTLLLPAYAAEGAGLFPYLAFMSPNALFPMISFFLFLNLAEYRNYLPLYAAGKTIAVILFYVWAFFSFPLAQSFIGGDDVVKWLILLGGVFITSLLDALSILGIWLLHKKLGTNGGI